MAGQHRRVRRTERVRVKRCKQCGGEIKSPVAFQVACSVPCAIKLARERVAKKRQRDAKRQVREAKARLMTRSDWLKKAQVAFNRYIRLRDRDKPCISCGRYDVVQWHAGHYRSVKSAPELRFTETNVAAQCSQCNDRLSGNLVEYRKGLIARIGIEAVEDLERERPPAKWTIDEIRQIESMYKKLARVLDNGR